MVSLIAIHQNHLQPSSSQAQVLRCPGFLMGAGYSVTTVCGATSVKILTWNFLKSVLWSCMSSLWCLHSGVPDLGKVWQALAGPLCWCQVNSLPNASLLGLLDSLPGQDVLAHKHCLSPVFLSISLLLQRAQTSSETYLLTRNWFSLCRFPPS